MTRALLAVSLMLGWPAAGQAPDAEAARRLLSSGHAAEAAAMYSELARLQPNNPGMLLNLSIAEYKAGHFPQAAESAAAALRIDPGLLPAHLFLGASQLEMGRLSDAVESLERVVKINPQERNGQLMLGEALLRSGRAGDALAHFQGASRLLPDNPRAWYGLGRSYELLGQRENAAEAWKRLSALPESVEAHTHRAEADEAEQRWSEAAAEWNAAVQLAPNNTSLRLKQAWSLFRRRDYDAAMAVLKTLLAKAEDPDVRFLYGACLLNLQQPDAALPFLQDALALNPKSAPARAAVGQALLQTGKPEQAIPLLEQALSADPDGTVHFQLFRAYQLTGQSDKARQALADYRRLRASAAPAP